MCLREGTKEDATFSVHYLPLREQDESCKKNMREGLVRKKRICRWRQMVIAAAVLGTSIVLWSHGDFSLSILMPTVRVSASCESNDEVEEQLNNLKDIRTKKS